MLSFPFFPYNPSMRFPGQRWIAAALVLLALAVFAGTLRNDFVNWDDDEYVVKNELIRRLDAKNVAGMFRSTNVSVYWAPITILSYAVDHAFWGLRPFGYHLTNTLLHALCTLLLYLLFCRILGRGDPDAARVPAGLAAALFAIHPVQVESVAWVSERKNVLAMALLLAAFLAWIRATRGRVRPGAYAAFLALLAAALLAKLHAAILPPLILLYEWIEGPARPDARPSAARRVLTSALLQLGKLDEAEKEIREALRIDPRDARANYDLARLAARRGDRETGLRALTRLHEGGFRDAGRLRSDPDLAFLMADPRVAALLGQMEGERP